MITLRWRRPAIRWLVVSLIGALPSLSAAQSANVAVASHEIARGVILTPADIGYFPSAVFRAAGGAQAPAVLELAAAGDTLVGWMTRRLITVGEPLRAPAVMPPVLVKSGDVVDVVYESDGVSVTMRGKATRAAANGERVIVRMDNQRKLEGTVVGPGRVRVN